MADKQVIVEILYDTEAAQRNVDDLTKAIVENKDAQEELRHAVKKGTITTEEYSKSMAVLSEEGKKATAERQANIKVIQAEENSISKLQKANSQLRKERDNTNISTKEGIEKVSELNKKIQKNDEVIKNNVSSLEKQRLNIGNYQSALDNLPAGLAKFVNGVRAADAAGWKFALNPIGAILAAITLVVAGLISIFKNFEPVLNWIEQKMAAVSAVFTVFKEAIIGLTFGGKSLTETFGGLGDAMSDAAKEAQNLKKAEQDLEDVTVQQIATQAKYKQQIDELLLQSKDRTKSEKERIALIEEALKIEDKAFAEKKALADEEFRIAKQKIIVGRRFTKEELKNIDERGISYLQEMQSKKGISDEEIKIYAEALAAKSQIEQESTAVREKAINRQNALLDKQAEDEKKRKEQKAKDNADAAKKLEETQKAEMDALVKKAEMDAKQVIAEKALADEAAAKLIEAKAIQVQKDKDERIAKKEKSKAEYAEDLQIAMDSMNQILQATQGFADKRVLILGEAFAKISTLNFKELKDGKETYIALGQAASGFTGLITASNAEQLKSLDEKYQSDLLMAGDNEAAKGEINKKYAKEKARIQTEQAKEEKLKALFDIGIATAIGVAKSFPNLILAGIVGGLGAVQLGAVASKPLPKFTTFAKGGMIGGNPHSQGGTKFVGSDGSMFEAERGEAMFVMKKDATAEIAALSAINESFGGRSFNRGASHLADGGQVNGVDIESAIRNGFANAPVPVVMVSDISLGLTNMDAVNRVGTI